MALLKLDFKEKIFTDIRFLTLKEAEIVFRDFLRKLIYKNKDDEEGKLIVKDILWDIVKFCLKNDFPPDAIQDTFSFYNYCLCNCSVWTLAECCRFFKDRLLNMKDCLTNEKSFKLIDYFKKTFLQQYKLLQAVMAEDKEDQVITLALDINCPPLTLPKLSSAKEIEVWAYEKNINAINALEKEKIEARKSIEYLSEGDKKMKIEAILKNVSFLPEYCQLKNLKKGIEGKEKSPVHEQLEDSLLKNMLTRISQIHLEAFKKNLQLKVDSVKNDVAFEAKRQKVPMPPQLAPPPTQEKEQEKNKKTKVSKSAKSRGKK